MAASLKSGKQADAMDTADTEKGDAFSVTALAAAGVDLKRAEKDKALALLTHHHVEFDPNSEEARRVKRKIDMHIMPLVFCVYLLQLMDKNALSFANIMGLSKDLGLTTNQYSWLGSIVYFGYLAGEIPATFFLQRVPLAKYFASMAMVWGVIVACHAACHGFGSMAAVRFLLGFIEVCTAPAVIYITGSWYTKTEQITRAAIWYTTSGWANVFGGFFAWAIYQADSFRWQGLFIFYGGLTFAAGAFCFFFLAASPTDAKWLTEEEKAIALERVRVNKTGTEVWAFSWPQLKECFMDVRFYMMFLLLVSTGLPNGGITAFGPAIIKQFGFTTSQSTLLNMGSGSATVLGTGIAVIIAKYTCRTVAGIYTLLLACVGCLMMLFIDPANYGARYAGYVLTLQFPICVLFIITWLTAGIAGSTKKFAFGCAYQLGYAVGNIIGPKTYQAYDAPNYYIAKWTMFAFIAFTAILMACYGSLHWLWNKRRDARDAADIQSGKNIAEVENIEFSDVTDFNMRSFRYPL